MPKIRLTLEDVGKMTWERLSRILPKEDMIHISQKMEKESPGFSDIERRWGLVGDISKQQGGEIRLPVD